MTNRREQNQGMKWIRLEKRLAIYLRDGLACVWCGVTVEDDRLTLDHLRPYSKGGTHEACNLVTSCARCNSSRGTRSVAAFARAVAGYLNRGVTAEAILGRVRLAQRRVIDVKAAKALIALRGGFVAATRGGER
jgi:hypothetical protein